MKQNCMSHSHTFQYIAFNALACQVGRCGVQLPRWFIGNRGSCQWGLLHIRSIKPWLGRGSTSTHMSQTLSGRRKGEPSGLWENSEALQGYSACRVTVFFYVGFIMEILASHSSARLNQAFIWVRFTATFPSAFYSDLYIRCDRESTAADLF